MADIPSLKSLVQQVRRDILRMVHKVNSGHPGGSLGCAEFLVALYNEVMDHNSDFNMHGKNEDLFFLSNTFRLINSRLQGHPTTHEGLPGIRIASGSLGQGLSVAIGAALSKKINKDPKTIFVLMGDGELQEGQNWEAFMFAAARNVDNIIVTVDLNGKQIDGTTNDVLDLGDVKSKFDSFGWKTLELNEGNNIEFIISKIAEAKNNLGKGMPIAILMKTEMGNGVDFMMNTHAWHGKAPNDDQLKIALSQNPITLGDY